MKLKICSFNARFDGAKDGINAFTCRTERIRDFLKAEEPDIIGFQEVTSTMRAWFVENMPDYYTVGGGRNPDCSGEAPLIAFKKRDMQLIGAKTDMLSPTPEKFGSRFAGTDQSKCPRSYCRLLLKHNEIDEPFYVYNVHTDHIGAISRTLASAQLVTDISSHGSLFFMTGDFNATPDASEIKLISAPERIVDVSSALGGTFHAYGKLESPVKIDYIFADSRAVATDCYVVADEPVEGVYISDHNPIVAIFEF